MFEIIASFVSRIITIDTEYDEEIKNIEAAEKAAMAKIEADHKSRMAAMDAAHKLDMDRINNMPKPKIIKDTAALKKHQELVSRFEALMAKHGR